MHQNKTRETGASVREFLAAVKSERKRKDSETVVRIMRPVSGKQPKMWGPSIVGFGKHRISGGGCIYINKLEDIDVDVLEEIYTKAFAIAGDA